MQTSKCRQAGCSVHSVEYEIPVSQIEALILMSGECEQYVRYYDHWIIVETRGKTSLNIKLQKINTITWKKCKTIFHRFLKEETMT